MTTISCFGCDAEILESEATSLTELFGVTPPNDPMFCDDCVERIESEPSSAGLF